MSGYCSLFLTGPSLILFMQTPGKDLQHLQLSNDLNVSDPNFLYFSSINILSYVRVPVFRPQNVVIIPIFMKGLACSFCYLYLLYYYYYYYYFTKYIQLCFCNWQINNTTSSTNTFIAYQYSVNDMLHVAVQMGPSTGFIRK